MKLFIVFFLTVYGGMHYFLFKRITSAVILSVFVKSILIFGMALLCLIPLFIVYLEHAGMHGAALFSAYIGYIWMGWLFIFLWISLFIDGVILVIRGVNRFRGTTFNFIKNDVSW